MERPEREEARRVTVRQLHGGVPLREIGEVLGVSESRVSELHTKAIRRLKTISARPTTPPRREGRRALAGLPFPGVGPSRVRCSP